MARAGCAVRAAARFSAVLARPKPRPMTIHERHCHGGFRELARTVLDAMQSPTGDMPRARNAFFELEDRAAGEAAPIIYAEMAEAAPE